MIKAKYLGDGNAFHNGIPARDLNEDDWERLSADERAVVDGSPLYRVRGEEPPKEPARTERAVPRTREEVTDGR